MYDINKTTTIIVDPFKENQTIEIGYQRDNKAVELEFEGLTGTDNWVCLVWDKKYMYIPIPTYKLPIEESYTLASSMYKMQIVKLSENGFKAHSPFSTLKLKVSAPNKYLEEKVPGPFEPAYNIVLATTEAIEKKLAAGEFDGLGILRIEKTRTEGKVDFYTITFTDGTSFEYQVKNGEDYNDSAQFKALAQQVKTDAGTASQAAQTATKAETAAQETLKTATLAKAEITKLEASAKSAASQAKTSETNAQGASNRAAAAASGANSAATQAAGSASTASQAAQDASGSASQAAGANSAAQQAKQAAMQSETNAATHEKNSGINAGQAQTSAGNALKEANRAKTEADKAKQEADFLANNPIEPEKTTFFDLYNVLDKSEFKTYNDRFIDYSGEMKKSINLLSISFKVDPNTQYTLYCKYPYTRNIIGGATDSLFDYGKQYDLLTADDIISTENCIYIRTKENTKYLFCYLYAEKVNYNFEDFALYKGKVIEPVIPTVKKENLPSDILYKETRIEKVTPKETTFFDIHNFMEEFVLYNDRYPNQNGRISPDNAVTTISFKVEPNTKYYLKFLKEFDRKNVVESVDNNFSVGETKIKIVKSQADLDVKYIEFETSVNTNYVMIYINSTKKIYEEKDFILFKGEPSVDVEPTVKKENLPYDILYKKFNSKPNGLDILIFGDSITDCRYLTIDKSNQTTLTYNKGLFDNSYTNRQGQLIKYYMWPSLLEQKIYCREMRCYAQSGASYKNDVRDTENERQNVSYQIQLAINDLSNPNGAFKVNDFNPDIIIFDLGTNDGEPNDTYESAMAKTVFKDDGTIINIDETLKNLDKNKFCEAARFSFLKIKKQFPSALCICGLPIQRSNNDTNENKIRVNLRKMAEKCGYIVDDGFAQSGIIRELQDIYLKDGLHPNDLGQKMKARERIKLIERYYMPLEEFENPEK